MNRSRQVAPFILIGIIVILVIAVVFSIGRAVFFRSSTTEPADTSTSELVMTDVSRSVQMAVRGPIIASEEFRSYEITISPDQRSFVTYSGYQERIIDDASFNNNVPAYEEFVYALSRANMMRGDVLEGDEDDTRGVCATGNVYEYSILTDGRTTKRLWTSDCRGSSGSLDANHDDLAQLFERQIPDARTLIRSADL